jgi:CBS domain-containing protein
VRNLGQLANDRSSFLADPLAMIVKEVMRRAPALDGSATLADVLGAIQMTGCEALPVVERSNGSVVVRQLVTVRDLPNLRSVAACATRGHAIGHTVLDLLTAIGRKPGRFPTISPNAALADAWGLMSDSHLTHLPVADEHDVIGMVSLVVTFSEFPHRSPTAGFWA